MKNFFYILFGGLSAVGFGIALTYGGTLAWQVMAPNFGFNPDRFSLPRAVSVVTQQASASTFVNGFKKTVRFSAYDEEDRINSIAQSLPLAPDGKVTAGSYIVKNLNLGDTLIEHNTDKSVPIASLTKLVTAVVARRLIEPNEKIEITESIISIYGNTAGLKKGETFLAEDLLYPLLMVSSNDTAEAFAQSYGRKKFIKAMNDFTQEIGAYRTYFADPSGLSAENVSSVSDIVLIIDWIRKNDPKIIEITSLKSKTIRSHTWTNPTHFLSQSSYIGGKNGYIPEAERTSVSLFEWGANKNLYAVVLLGSLSRDEDVMALLSKVK